MLIEFLKLLAERMAQASSPWQMYQAIRMFSTKWSLIVTFEYFPTLAREGCFSLVVVVVFVLSLFST